MERWVRFALIAPVRVHQREVGDENAALEHVAYRRQQILGGARFVDVCAGSGRKCYIYQSLVLVNRQKDDTITVFRESSRRLDAVHFRHRDVEHDDIGLKPLGGYQRGIPVSRRPHHFIGGLEEKTHHFQHGAVIVRQEYTWSVQKRLLAELGGNMSIFAGKWRYRRPPACIGSYLGTENTLKNRCFNTVKLRIV